MLPRPNSHHRSEIFYFCDGSGILKFRFGGFLIKFYSFSSSSVGLTISNIVASNGLAKVL